jgi:hypothetical protein
MVIQESLAGQTHSFGDSATGDFAIPGPRNCLCGFSSSQRIQDLPDHNARAFEGGFAVANLRVGDNILAQLEPRFHTTSSGISHGKNLPMGSRNFKPICG